MRAQGFGVGFVSEASELVPKVRGERGGPGWAAVPDVMRENLVRGYRALNPKP